MLRELLKALGPTVQDAFHPNGAGFLLNGGFVFKCAGVTVIDPDTGIPSITDQHVIGKLSGGPDDLYPIPRYFPDNPEHPGSNIEVNDSLFTLDPSQPTTFDPTKGVCGVCGKPILLS